MPLLYTLAFGLLFLVLSPLLALHSKTREGWRERFGYYRKDAFPRRSGRGPRFWLHGASAGDLLSLSPIVRELKLRFPDCTVILSTLTGSGYQMASERIKGIDGIVYVPWDLPGPTRRAMRAIDPDVLVLEYTEIWPNLIRAAKRHGARIALTNGRFQPAKMRSYALLFSLVGNPLKLIDLFLMREDEEAERALRLGAPLERVWVTGNTKFDALVPSRAADGDQGLRRAFCFPAGARILIAGSTHDGEEGALIEVYRRLVAEHPELCLVIAPRYVERAGKVKALAEAAGFRVRLRSDPEPSAQRCQVALLDTIGELSQAYRQGTLVFVGGSFTSRGGQNILEPAAQGRPVLFGPNMDNFHDSVKVLVGRGGIQVNDPDHLFRVANELLAKPEKIEELGELAFSAVTQIRGASARNVACMARVLEPRAEPDRGAESAGQPERSERGVGR